MVNKQNIIIFIDWYVPAYKAGGPIRSVYNLVETLKDEFNFYIITTNIDIDGEVLSSIEDNKWIEQGSAQVLYLPLEEVTRKRLKKEVKLINPSKIYLNSLFSAKFTLLPLMLFRKKYEVVVAPRGMLGKESLAIKAAKKKLFLTLAKIRGLYNNVIWHASSNIESEEILNMFGRRVNVKIARNLTLVNDSFQPINKTVGTLKIIMVGRVVPIKNVHFFLNELKSISNIGSVDVAIVGPLEDDLYFEECTQLVNELPENIKVEFRGGIPPLKIAGLYNDYHVLVSSSLNENYGHSIAEALTFGRPIIVSNNTPWKKIKELGIGVNLDLKDGLFAKEFKRFVQMNNEEFLIMQKKAKAYALENLKDKEEINKSISLFK